MPQLRASQQIRLALDHLRRGPKRLGWRAMPWLMRTGTRASALGAAVWLLFLPLAALDVGSYSIDDQAVSGPYFLIHADLELLPFIGLLHAHAYGYWTERLWARPLPIVFWLLVDAALFGQILSGEVEGADAIGVVVWALLYVACAVWYCFFKPSVAKYYRALEHAYEQDAATTEVRAPNEHSS